jgi:hypothetical protein
MDKISSACQSPTSSEPLDQFARDDAIQKLTQEFIGLGNLEKKDEITRNMTVKKKVVVHRGRPVDFEFSSQIAAETGIAPSFARSTAEEPVFAPVDGPGIAQRTVATQSSVPPSSANSIFPSAIGASPRVPRPWGVPETKTSNAIHALHSSPVPAPSPHSTQSSVMHGTSSRLSHSASGLATSTESFQKYSEQNNFFVHPNQSTRDTSYQEAAKSWSPITPTSGHMKQANLSQQVSPPPTRQTCPPPRPKEFKSVTSSHKMTRKKALQAACDPPSFDLGFDSPKKDRQESSADMLNDDDYWTEDMEKEAYALCERVELEKRLNSANANIQEEPMQNDSELQTPAGVGIGDAANKEISESNSTSSFAQMKQRRLIKQALCKLSPYLTYVDRSLYTCSAEVKDLYAAVTAHGRRSKRCQEVDKR